MIARCNCTSNSKGSTAGAQFQDRTYGKGNRVFNYSPKKNVIRCTICSKEQMVQKKEVEAEKKTKGKAKEVVAKEATKEQKKK